jgi:hypothetical protein
MLLTQAAAAFLAMLCMMMPLPWPVLGLAAAAMAAVTGVRGIRLARRNLLGAKMATYFVWGLAMVGLISVYTVPMAATWGAQWDYQQCIERSITIEGRDGCLTDFKEQTKLDWARLNGLLGQ